MSGVGQCCWCDKPAVCSIIHDGAGEGTHDLACGEHAVEHGTFKPWCPKCGRVDHLQVCKPAYFAVTSVEVRGRYPYVDYSEDADDIDHEAIPDVFCLAPECGWSEPHDKYAYSLIEPAHALARDLAAL